ncbi:MAG: phosphate acyltransferase PlsX [Endomicrobia bacterium]|nr:phosphate acyltransferase PlsX [Endomicrobiia bacterium]
MKIAVDGMGGDHNIPHINIEGANLALQEDKNLEVVLVGPEKLLLENIDKAIHLKDVRKRIKVVNADEIVYMDEQPSKVLRSKQNSSIGVGIHLLKNDIVDAFVSAGNSGAVVAFSLTQIGTVKNVDRPAIAAVLPTISTRCVILDVGANVDCKPQHLVEFALMGKIYCEKLLNLNNPKVALLSIGTEEGKGNTQSLLAYQLLLEQKSLNFIGNIEGKDIPFGVADVVVVDGFVGNIVLKFGEGIAEVLLKLIKQSLKKHPFAWFALPFVWNAIRDLRKKVDFTEYGGAPLLGLEKVCIISHGRSNAKAIKNAILTAKQMVEKRVNYIISESMKRIYE